MSEKIRWTVNESRKPRPYLL